MEKWEPYHWEKAENIGKLTYYYCNKNRSDLPVRDVCNDHGAGFKTEPHYEGTSGNFGTYNDNYRSCNARSINSMIKNKRANIIFFVTYYTGKNKSFGRSDYKRRYFVTGFYRMDKIRLMNKKTKANKKNPYSVKCCSPFFVSIKEAFEITTDVLRRWRPARNSDKIYGNQLKFLLTEPQTQELLRHFKNQKNIIDSYIDETKKLQNQSPQKIKTQECRKSKDHN